MIIVTTTAVDSTEEAKKKLERVSEEPGFTFGYIKTINHTNKRGDHVLTRDYVVTIFDVKDESLPPSSPGRIGHHEVKGFIKSK
jgi:hypothetical protein